MLRRDSLAFVFVLAFSLGVAISQGKPDSSQSFLPAKVGDTLVYEEAYSNGNADAKRLITRTVVMADKTTTGMTVAIKERSDGSVEFYQQSSSGVYLACRDIQPFDPPACVLRLPLKKGDTWEINDPKVFPVPIKFATGEEEEVEVPAGKFKAVRVEKKIVFPDAKTVRVTDWVVPGYGVVKARARLADGTEMVIVLKSFTHAKD